MNADTVPGQDSRYAPDFLPKWQVKNDGKSLSPALAKGNKDDE
jgi:hypothetical protein